MDRDTRMTEWPSWFTDYGGSNLMHQAAYITATFPRNTWPKTQTPIWFMEWLICIRDAKRQNLCWASAVLNLQLILLQMWTQLIQKDLIAYCIYILKSTLNATLRPVQKDLTQKVCLIYQEPVCIKSRLVVCKTQEQSETDVENERKRSLRFFVAVRKNVDFQGFERDSHIFH